MNEVKEQLVIQEILKNGHSIVKIRVYDTSEDEVPENKDNFCYKMTEILSEVKKNCEIIY